MSLEIHEVQLIQSRHQRRNATAETVGRIQKRKKKERKKERKNNVDRKQHFPKAAGDLPGDEESECEDESNATTMPSRDKHTDVAHEHEHSEIDVGYGSERKIRQQCSCNRCI